jgi:hypothetical protein
MDAMNEDKGANDIDNARCFREHEDDCPEFASSFRLYFMVISSFEIHCMASTKCLDTD